MGEIADLMLDGGMCQGCGELLHGGDDGPGFPGWCEGCMPADGLEAARKRSPLRAKRPKTIPCPNCTKLFNTPDALKWHRQAKEH
jgi:hypothetical protein